MFSSMSLQLNYFLSDSLNADYHPDIHLKQLDNIIQFLMDDNSSTTTTSTNTSTMCQNTTKSVNRTQTRGYHKTSASNQHLPTLDQHTNCSHTNTDNNCLVSTLDHHVLKETTNCSASHPVQQLLSLTHSGLITNDQSTLSMFNHGLNTIVPQDMYKVNHIPKQQDIYYKATEIPCSLMRRNTFGSNRYHPWRTSTLQPIRGY